jgi:hypothetical protein
MNDRRATLLSAKLRASRWPHLPRNADALLCDARGVVELALFESSRGEPSERRREVPELLLGTQVIDRTFGATSRLFELLEKKA